VAGLFLAALGSFKAVPEFHQLVMNVYHALPSWLEDLAGTAIALYAWYHTAHSAAGILASARTIEASPDAPTIAQVNAADTRSK
jgi:hypothetical protein